MFSCSNGESSASSFSPDSKHSSGANTGLRLASADSRKFPRSFAVEKGETDVQAPGQALVTRLTCPLQKIYVTNEDPVGHLVSRSMLHNESKNCVRVLFWSNRRLKGR